MEQDVIKLGRQTSKISILLTRQLSNTFRIERSLEKKSIVLKSKLVEDRGRTLKNLQSRDKDKQKKGLLGGAFGLGLGGGLLRRGIKRAPKSSSLLNIQKTTNLSNLKIGKIGKIGGRLGPLAVLGAGLDFAGRRSQGQTNLQAGVGAGGGLAGALAGAKTGALIGTAVGGPIGTVVGGLGGSIIGSLAGGRLADLFTGANRRRQFEEQRTIARTETSLFSQALDDFDDVLDKFENIFSDAPVKREDEESLEQREEREKPSRPPISDKKKNERKLKVNATKTLVAVGLITLIAFQLSKGKIDLKSANALIKLAASKPPSFQKLPVKIQLQTLLKETKKEALLKRMSESPFLTKRGTVIPGQKGAPPKIIKKTNIIKERKDFKKIIEDLKNLNNKAQKSEDAETLFKDFGKLFRQKSDIQGSVELLRKFIRDPRGLEGTSLEAIKKNTDMVFDVIKQFKKEGLLSPKQIESADKLLRVIERRLKQIGLGKDSKITPDFTKDELKVLDELLKIVPRLKKSPLSDVLSKKLEPESTNTNIASLAPMGNIFILGGNGGESPPPLVINETDGGETQVVTINPYDAVAQNLMFESALTT